jgi:glucose/arabinose dehydrogenase
MMLVSSGSIADPVFTTRIVKDNLFIPWEIIYGPDDHIWFTQKNGYICRTEPSSGHTDTVHHEPETVIRGEGGMLGMALHPDFSVNPYLYVAYNYLKNGSYTEKIVRYTYNGQTLQDPFILLDDIDAANNHNGCRLLIVDDMLFITTGDAELASTAQDLNTLNGKILRIHLDGTIPADNPVPGSPVWSWGHRNAQGLARADGILYSSEHGPSTDDELNIIQKGRNYGWPTVTGFCSTPGEQAFCADSNVAEPLAAWTPTLAVSDIAYYSDDKLMFPAWHHSILMTTLKGRKLYQLRPTVDSSGTSVIITEIEGVDFGRLRDVCIAPDGRVFISTSNAPASGNGEKNDRIIELYDPLFWGTVHQHKLAAVSIYPNPVTGDAMYLSAGGYSSEAVHHGIISDIQGRILHSSLVALPGKLPVSNLPAGIYFLQLRDPDGNARTQKFVKL